MHRPPDVDNIQDFTQYYRLGIIALHENTGVPTPIKILEVDGNRVAYHVIGSADVKAIQYRDLLERGIFGVPQYGMVEAYSGLLYLFRPTHRRMDRGHRASSCNIAVLTPEIFAAQGYRKSNDAWKMDDEVIKFTFNPRYRGSLQEAYIACNNTVVGAAIDRVWGLVVNPDRVHPCLYYKTTMVGVVTGPYVVECLDVEKYGALVTTSFPMVRVV